MKDSHLRHLNQTISAAEFDRQSPLSLPLPASEQKKHSFSSGADQFHHLKVAYAQIWAAQLKASGKRPKNHQFSWLSVERIKVHMGQKYQRRFYYESTIQPPSHSFVGVIPQEPLLPWL